MNRPYGAPTQKLGRPTLCGGLLDKQKAELGCLFLQTVDFTFPLAPVVFLACDIMKRFTVLEHEIERPCYLVGGGNDSFAMPFLAPHLTKEDAKGALCLCRQLGPPTEIPDRYDCGS